MSYAYDVFLSYPREGVIADWVTQHFLPLFKSHLGEALPSRPHIFFDQRGVAVGDAWPLRLQEALARSRCLVPLWAPSYFRSRWCLMETLVMLRREREAGYGGLNNPTRLIYPVRAFDGEHFPDFANTIQQADFRDFVLLSPAFKETRRYLEFEEAVRGFVPYVARGIREAPEWQAPWLKARPEDVSAEEPKRADYAFELPRLG